MQEETARERGGTRMRSEEGQVSWGSPMAWAERHLRAAVRLPRAMHGSCAREATIEGRYSGCGAAPALNQRTTLR